MIALAMDSMDLLVLSTDSRLACSGFIAGRDNDGRTEDEARASRGRAEDFSWGAALERRGEPRTSRGRAEDEPRISGGAQLRKGGAAEDEPRRSRG